MMTNIFNFKWCRAGSVVPNFKELPKPPPKKPPPPKPVVIPWGKPASVLPKGMERLSIEEELTRLHFTFRKMESSQRHFHEESELVLRRQMTMLETLQLDNRMTQDKIDLFYPEDYAEEMRRLNAECAIWVDKIEIEVQRVQELETANTTLYTDEYSSKKTMGGIHAAKEHNQATQIHIHILENRVFKAMQDLTVIQWHNKLMQDEMQSLEVEHVLFNELHAKMEIELQETMEEMEKLINTSYELYDERHDYHRLISEILELMEEGDAYTRWQTFGTWIGMDGRPLAETALATDKERATKMKQKRATLPLTNDADLKKMFVIEDGEACTALRSTQHTRKYERLIEIKAFMNIQNLLSLKTEQVDDVSPILIAARERHAQLVRDVQELNHQIEDAIAFKLDRYGDDEEFEMERNDFLEIIRELKKQIFLVFKEAGCLNWDPDLEKGIQEGTISDDESLETAISRLFVKTEDFIVEMSAPIGFGPVTHPSDS